MTQPQIDFLPSSFTHGRRRHKRVCREAALVLAMAGCLAGWWAVRSHRDAGLRQYAASLRQQVHAADVQQNAMSRLRIEHKNLIHQVSVHRELAQPMTPTQLLDQLGAALPETVAVRGMSLVAQRPDPAPKSEPGEKNKADKSKVKPSGPNLLRLDLEALAPDDLTVARSVAALSDHPLFNGVKMRYSRASDPRQGGRRGRVFKLSMVIDLNRRFRWIPDPAAAKAKNPAQAQAPTDSQTLTQGVSLAH